MKKRTYLRLRVLALLLVYLLSNSSGILHHHHDVEETFFQEAHACEKAAYFANSDKHCEHKAHFSQAEEKCSLCDHHTFSPHTFTFFESSCLEIPLGNEFSGFPVPGIQQVAIQLSGRGPPMV